MAGTIYSGTYVSGIVLSNPATQLPATVTGRISNNNHSAIFGQAGVGWSVINQGAVENTGTAGFGVDLKGGGTVENGPSGASTALIAGYGGVAIAGGAGTVTNFATIEGRGSRHDGVELFAGGYVGNGATTDTAASISGGRHAVVIRNFAGTVVNVGTLAAAGTYGVVDLFAGGSVTNGSSASTAALISGSGNGVYVAGAAVSVANFGTIEAGWGVFARAGGSVTNGSSDATNALIDAANKGVYISGAAGAVTNFGTIDGRGSRHDGVGLFAGGCVGNGTSSDTAASISGGRHAVVIRNAAGTVANFGTLAATGTFGVVSLSAGGSVTNGSSASTAALISGSDNGVYVAGAAGTVTNFATIDGGWGVVLHARGEVTNGSAASSAALISGSARGISITAPAATVVNFGTIEGQSAVVLRAGGSVSNEDSGQIRGTAGDAIFISGRYGKVTNFGTITSAGTGIDLASGGRVVNGSITSTNALISGRIIGGFETITNFGTIGDVKLDAGIITNGDAASTVVQMGGVSMFDGTVTNFGTGLGVFMRSRGTLVNGSPLSTTARFNGAISFSGYGSSISNFGTIVAPHGDAIRLGGGNVTNGSAVDTSALIGGGIDFYGFTSTLTNFGTIDYGIRFAGRTGGLVINGSTADTAALITSRNGPILSGYQSVTLVNFGTLQATDAGSGGVSMTSQPSNCKVTNGSTSDTRALLSGGQYGVKMLVGYISDNVTNFGTVQAFGTASAGISLLAGTNLGADGGNVTNGSAASTAALICGGHYGIYCGSRGVSTALTNFGTVAATGTGGIGVRLTMPGTITNFGTISGSADAVSITGTAGGKLIVEPGAVFVGQVLGGGTSEIDFAMTGAADMSNVSGFNTIMLGNGESHSLALTDANFATVSGAITVDDGDSGNMVDGSALSSTDAIIVNAGSGADTLTGGAGADVFYAGGDTTMTGGAGANQFTFADIGTNGITDFAASASNELVFSNAGFALGLGGATAAPQALPAGLFVADSDGHFTNATQRFAYGTGNGELFFSSAGSAGTAHLVANLTGNSAVSTAQLFFFT